MVSGSELLVWLSGFNAFIATLRFLVIFPTLWHFGATSTVFFSFQFFVAIVVNCATSISPVLVSNNLKSAGINNILTINDFIQKSNSLINIPWFVNQHRKEIINHLPWWLEFYDQLADEESKKHFLM